MRIRVLIVAALAAAMLWSCQELPPVNEPDDNSEETVEEPGLPGIDDSSAPGLISAEIPSLVQSKVSLSASDAPGLALAWETGDLLRIIGSSSEVFSIVEEGMTPSKAGFTGNPVKGDSFTVLYPGTYETEAAWGSRSYTGQKQKGNGSTDHLFWEARLAGLGSYSSLVFDGAGFSQNGVVKFSFSLPERFDGLDNISLTAPETVFPTTNAAYGPKAATLSLALEDLSFEGDSRAVTAYLMVSATPVVLAGGSEYTVTLTGPGGQEESVTKTAPADGLQIGDGVVTVITLDAGDLHEPLFWGGSGTSGDPYQIKTATHLQNMNNKISEVAGANTLYFKLVDDIDLNGVSLDYSNGASANKYPIDFDGDGHTISNYNKTNKTASLFGKLNGAVYNVKFKDATVTPAATSSGGLLAFRAGDADSPVSIHDITVDGLTLTWENTTSSNTTVVGGLVGYLTNGQVYNVTVTNLSIAATGNNVGGIVGKTETAASTISSCTVSGSVSGLRYVGGILGLSDVAGTTVSGCTSSGTVTGNSSGAADTGGIVGRANNTLSVESCTSSADVTAYSQLGGIIGSANGTVSKCASSGKITTLAAAASGNASAYTGGIAGFNNGSLEVSECCFTGKITGTVNSIHVGGIVGCQYGSNALTLRNCYSSGSITTTRAYTGGLLGQVQNGKITVSNCYSSMAMTAGQGSVNGLGGLIGGSNGTTAEWNVSGCLAWHSKIEFNMTAKADRSYDGVIVGQMHSGSSTASTSFTNCYYRNDLDYTGYKTDGVSRTPLDEDDLTKSVGKGYYDGHRAAAGVSCSAQATALGWSAEIWNLTGDYPALKNLAQ